MAEAPTPRRAATSDLRRGRDADAIEDLKKLIMSEKQRAKAGTAIGRGGAGSGSDDDDAGGDDEGTAKNKKKALEAQEAAKAAAKPKGVWRKGKFIAHEDTEEGRYRDRAKERRKGINPDYDGEIAKMVEVDAEQSKYLGGDLKHTHLVRGLDYALLSKVKEETRQKQEEERAAQAALAAQSGGKMSSSDQQLDAEADEMMQQAPVIRTYTGKALYRALTAVTKQKAPDFSRIAYEFDLSTEAANDVPTMLSRSNADAGGDADDDEVTHDRINCTLENDLLSRMQDSLEQFRIHGKPGRRRKRKHSGSISTTATDTTAADDTASVNSGTSSNRRQKVTVHDDDDISIFDDVVGPYVAPEVANLKHSSSSSSNSANTVLPFVPPLPPDDANSFEFKPPPPPLPPGGTEMAVTENVVTKDAPVGKSIFSGLRTSTAATLYENDDSNIDMSIAAPSKDDISKSIRSAAASANRSSSVKTAAAAAAQQQQEHDAAGIGKIDRDILGAGGASRGGHSLAQGTYDVFPETAMYGDAGNSDSEGESSTAKPHSKLGEQLGKKAEKAATAASHKDTSKSTNSITNDSSSSSNAVSNGTGSRRERRKRKFTDAPTDA